MSAPPHMPCAMILWNMSLLANSSSTCAGLTSPDMIANSSMSFWVRVREMLALSPAFNSSNVRFSMRSTSVAKLISSPDIVQALGRDATLIGLAGGTTEQAEEKCRGYHVLKGHGFTGCGRTAILGSVGLYSLPRAKPKGQRLSRLYLSSRGGSSLRGICFRYSFRSL